MVDTIRDFLCAKLWAKSRCYVADCMDGEGPEQICPHKQKIRELVRDLKHYENISSGIKDMETENKLQSICHCDWGRGGHKSIECIILNLKDSIINEYRSRTY